MAFMRRVLFCGLAIFLCLSAVAQQTDVNRYTVFTGFDYLIGPGRNLTARGFEGDFGVTIKPWMSRGGDFGAAGDAVLSGAGTINGSETVYALLLQQIGINPAQVNVPFRSTTCIFAAGPQFYLRKFKKVTFFARPGFGGIHEVADISLSPQLIFVFQNVLHAPVPRSHQTDTTWFVGVGGGIDINLSPRDRAALRDRLGEHPPVLGPADAPAKLRPFSTGATFRWGHLE
jgi:hypothetical protein